MSSAAVDKSSSFSRAN